ncbi:hypothetical protein [Rhizorhabdus histidinilytica]|uniref:Uncharacterized protein n=1 Tax=Rhizorhabdus histidinilytica TaxID=439228 RepID=A0A1T5CHY6_9SPHN|nr:hypothetical protein [Rhizorhabdus histidinilytica]SKB58931.1 hypothetical protein SAMN06295920_10469 [Rhizorhabdus histidinilytica]
MNAPHIHRARRTFSASKAVEVQGSVLTEIKADDDITFKDMARVLGRSEDRAAIYAAGGSAMDLPTFLAGCDVWGGRFADPLLRLAGGRWAEAGAICSSDDRAALTLAMLLPAIIEIEADGITEAEELRPHAQLIRKVNALTRRWLDMLAQSHGASE